MTALFHLWPAPAAPVHPAPRTVIYIDGLNLYYGAVKSTPALKWLNLERFCRLLRPLDDIRRIRIISGDSDLVPAVNMVRQRFGQKKIFVYVRSRNPVRGAAVELRTSAHVHRVLPLILLSKSQFPNQMPDGAGGMLRRPATWVLCTLPSFVSNLFPTRKPADVRKDQRSESLAHCETGSVL